MAAVQAEPASAAHSSFRADDRSAAGSAAAPSAYKAGAARARARPLLRARTQVRGEQRAEATAEQLHATFPAPACGHISRVAHRLVLERTDPSFARNCRGGALEAALRGGGGGGGGTSPPAGRSLDGTAEVGASRIGSARGSRTSVQGEDAAPARLSTLEQEALELLAPRRAQLPAFLQSPAATAVPVSAENADALAEEAAASPGPAGDGLAPEAWFDGVVRAHLSGLWTAHAQAIDCDVQEVATEIERSHTALLDRAARMTDFSLPELREAAHAFCGRLRGALLSFTRRVRDEEDAYATSVVRGVRSAYRRGVACTVKGCSKDAQRQLRAQAEAAEAKLDTCRAAATAAAAQAAAAERRRGEEAATARCLQAEQGAEARVRAAEERAQRAETRCTQLTREAEALREELAAARRHAGELRRQVTPRELRQPSMHARTAPPALLAPVLSQSSAQGQALLHSGLLSGVDPP